MRTAALMIMVLFGYAMQAQQLTPVFEKEGNKIQGTFYHDTGKIKQQGFYNAEGVLHGVWKTYDALGNKISKGQYDNGVKVGTWYFWGAQKCTEVQYKDNVIMSVKHKFAKNAIVTTD